MSRFIATLLATSMVPVLVASASAAEAPARGACRADIQTYCQGVEPGGGRILKCLKENEASLSDGCKQALAQLLARIEERRQQQQQQGGQTN